MKRATISVSDALLISALGLPEDTILLDARFDAALGMLEVTVQHEGLRDEPEGSVGRAVPVFRVEDGHARLVGWGQA